MSLLATVLATMALCKFYPAASIWETELEAIYFLGAFVLLGVLIYGTFQYRGRDKAASRTGDEITRERYRRNEV